MKSLILILVALVSMSAFAEPGKVVGQMGLVEGEVLVDSKLVQKSASVREGSVIEVKKGHATLILGKGSVFQLAQDSKMVVSAYGVKDSGQKEDAELDLKFGRTRALILNQGNEKKDIKIKARAATMGVRGTEIYVSAPADTAKPIQFFTLEGKAEVTAHSGAAPVPVNQNQGVTTSGTAPTSGSGGGPTGGGAATSGKSQNAGDVSQSSMSVNEVKSEIKASGLETSASQLPPPPQGPRPGPGNLSGQLTIGSLPPIHFDPLQDRSSPLNMAPHFCNAATGVCN